MSDYQQEQQLEDQDIQNNHDQEQYQQEYQEDQQEVNGEQVPQDFGNLEQLSPEEQQQYILLLQEKLQNLQAQVQKSQNPSNQSTAQKQQRTSNQNFQRSPQQQQKKSNTKVPQYPRAYDDWIIKQSISPQKYEQIQQHFTHSSTYFKDTKECTFKPQICEKSTKIITKNYKRNEKISPEKYMKEYLYQDALNRKSKTENLKKKINSEISLEQNKSNIGIKSQAIVLRKIEDTLNLLLNEISEDSETLTFENLGLFYQQLGLFKVLKFQKFSQNETSLYLSTREKVNLQRLGLEMQFHEQIWKILTQNTKVNNIKRGLLFDVTMVLLEKRLYINKSALLLQSVINDNLAEEQQEQQNGEQQDQEEEKPTWSLEQLITEFRALFDDKTQFMEYYANKKPILSSVNEQENSQQKPSFQPEICKKSQKLDFINNQNSNRFDLLYAHSKYLQEKKIEQKVKSEIEEQDKYTFQPLTNNYNFADFSDVSQNRFEKLYNLNEQKLQKQHNKKSQLEYERSLKQDQECTFKPNKYSQVPIRNLNDKSVVEEVKGSSIYIQRNQKARIDKEFQDSYWDRKRESYLQHDVSQTTNVIPFNFSQSNYKSFRKERGELLGNVDVNYAKGKKAKIAIYRGDDAEVCAVNFAKIHGLSTDMTICLTEMLEKYIQSFENENIQDHQEQQQQDEQQQEYQQENDNEVEPQNYQDDENNNNNQAVI